MADDHDTREHADAPVPPRAARQGRGIRGWWAVGLLALAVFVPVVAGIAVWRAAETRAILPGLDGCRTVRDRVAQVQCYTDEFEQMAAKDGLSAALRDVDRAAEASVTLGADCHVAWHPVGEADGRAAARERTGYDNIVAKTTCQQGYAHGYTIGYMGVREPSMDELVQIVRDECGGSSGLNALFNCTHAYGHVIARRYDGDAARGIRACERVDYAALPGADVPSPVPGERPPVLVGAEHQCLYGLYMEISLIEVGAGTTTLDNCGTATSQAARKACYAYLPARVNGIVGSMEEAGRACHELAPAGDLRDSCVKTFSMGLPDAEHCRYLVVEAEQQQCRRVIHIRDEQEDVLAFASGEPDSLDSPVLVEPEPGVTAPAPDEAPDAPTPPA